MIVTKCAVNTEPPPAEMQRGGFFCRTDPTLTDFCAIVLVVWERLCNFAPDRSRDGSLICS